MMFGHLVSQRTTIELTCRINNWRTLHKALEEAERRGDEMIQWHAWDLSWPS